MRERSCMGSGDIVRYERDFHSERLGRGTGLHVAALEVGLSQGVVCEGQRGGAGLEFAVGPGLMQKAGAEPDPS